MRNHNLLASAVNTAMAYDRPLALTFGDGRVVEGRVVRCEIDRMSPKGARSNLVLTLGGGGVVRLADVESARWVC